MTSNERAEMAAEYKSSGMCNCCQAVMKAYSDSVNVSEDNLMQMGAGFGGGMGCMEATCGALCGAQLILGLMKFQAKPIRQDAADLYRKFTEKCGASICKEIKGVKTGKILCSCDDCVYNAVEILEEVL